MESQAHILVIDDDERIRKLIQTYLAENGLLTSSADSADNARRKMKSLIFDLIILDVMMPEENGIDFMRSLSAHPPRPPILMLTALGEAENRIHGLEAGADDYLPKPFEPKELLLRIQKLLERTRATQSNPITMGQFAFENDVLTKNNQRVALNNSDIALLNLFARAPNQVFSRIAIADECQLESERSVDVRINRLRRKIEPNPNKPIYLQTVRHIGYILKPDHIRPENH